MRDATKRIKTGVLALLLTVGSGAEALAHIRLTVPTPRDTRDDHKDNTARDPEFMQPCGSVRTSQQTITSVQSGGDLSVQWTETVDHTGCFYIDFATSDAGPFEMLAMIEDGASSTPKMWTQKVKLPSAAATDSAVLRVRQYMSGTKACPTNPMAGISYFTCANVRVLGSGSSGDAGVSDAGTGTGGGAGSGGGKADAGMTATGGSSATGGAAGTGGATATGGSSSATGGSATGGAATGGAVSTVTGGHASGGSGGGGSSGGCAVVGRDGGMGAIALAMLGLFLRTGRRRKKLASH